jgi:hypothetical protein
MTGTDSTGQVVLILINLHRTIPAEKFRLRNSDCCTAPLVQHKTHIRLLYTKIASLGKIKVVLFLIGQNSLLAQHRFLKLTGID